MNKLIKISEILADLSAHTSMLCEIYVYRLSSSKLSVLQYANVHILCKYGSCLFPNSTGIMSYYLSQEEKDYKLFYIVVSLKIDRNLIKFSYLIL